MSSEQALRNKAFAFHFFNLDYTAQDQGYVIRKRKIKNETQEIQQAFFLTVNLPVFFLSLHVVQVFYPDLQRDESKEVILQGKNHLKSYELFTISQHLLKDCMGPGNMFHTRAEEITRKQSLLLGRLGDLIYKEHFREIWEILAQWYARMSKQHRRC